MLDWVLTGYGSVGLFGIGLGLGLVVPTVIRASTRLFGVAATSLQSTKMVLVVRSDLNMGRGKIASQCSHAAIQCYVKGTEIQKPIMWSWFLHGQPKVVLKAASESELLSLHEKAKSLKLVCCIIHDAGRTQLEPGTATVLGIGPGLVNKIDCVTSHLKLL